MRFSRLANRRTQFFNHLSTWSWYTSSNLKCGRVGSTSVQTKSHRWCTTDLMTVKFYEVFIAFLWLLFTVRHLMNFFMSSFRRGMGAKVRHGLFVPWISMPPPRECFQHGGMLCRIFCFFFYVSLSMKSRNECKHTFVQIWRHCDFWYLVGAFRKETVFKMYAI